jgi:hypothetical protein
MKKQTQLAMVFSLLLITAPRLAGLTVVIRTGFLLLSISLSYGKIRGQNLSNTKKILGHGFVMINIELARNTLTLG